MKRKKLTATHHIERRLFCGALSLVIALSGVYVYFVSAAIAHVVVRKEVSQEITDAQTRISELESAYIEAKSEVGEETVRSYGFEKNEEKIFVVRKPADLALSKRDEAERSFSY